MSKGNIRSDKGGTHKHFSGMPIHQDNGKGMCKVCGKSMPGTKLEKGRGREGTMEHKATGLTNSRRLLD